jgi:hypothetical protein
VKIAQDELESFPDGRFVIENISNVGCSLKLSSNAKYMCLSLANKVVESKTPKRKLSRVHYVATADEQFNKNTVIQMIPEHDEWYVRLKAPSRHHVISLNVETRDNPVLGAVSLEQALRNGRFRVAVVGKVQ